MDTPKEATLEEQIQFCLVLKFAMASDHFNGDNILDKKWQDVAATVASRDAGFPYRLGSHWLEAKRYMLTLVQVRRE